MIPSYSEAPTYTVSPTSPSPFDYKSTSALILDGPEAENSHHLSMVRSTSWGRNLDAEDLCRDSSHASHNNFFWSHTVDMSCRHSAGGECRVPVQLSLGLERVPFHCVFTGWQAGGPVWIPFYSNANPIHEVPLG